MCSERYGKSGACIYLGGGGRGVLIGRKTETLRPQCEGVEAIEVFLIVLWV
jgi:hypothetical protein